MTVRSILYRTQRGMGDVEAARRGRLGKRLLRRQVSRRIVGPMLNRIFR